MRHYDYRSEYHYEYEDEKSSEIIEFERKFEALQEFYTALYQELSSDEPLDLSSIYHHMSEIAGYLNIDERQFGDLNIARESKILKFKGI